MLSNPGQQLALEGHDLAHDLLRRLADSVEASVDDGWIVTTPRHRAKARSFYDVKVPEDSDSDS